MSKEGEAQPNETDLSEVDGAVWDVDSDFSGLGLEDRNDMRRLGKRQEYRRIFGPTATFGFISMYLCTWECECDTAESSNERPRVALPRNHCLPESLQPTSSSTY